MIACVITLLVCITVVACTFFICMTINSPSQLFDRDKHWYELKHGAREVRTTDKEFFIQELEQRGTNGE